MFWAFSILAIGILVSSCNQDKATAAEDKQETTSMQQSAGQVNEVAEKGHKSGKSGDIQPEYLTTADFKAKIWDYENDPEAWNYKGELPCIVDFYADWCKPCKMVAPIMDDLADYYKGRVLFYKVNTDKERELSTVFQINSIPAILFAPGEGKPAMQPGALSKEEYIKIIDEFVLKIDNNKNKINKTES